jgi:hypothetical protein
MTDVDEAYQRHCRLRAILDAARRTALNQPVSQRNRDLGLIGPEDKTETARSSLEAAFDQMGRQIERAGILDLCAVFEEAFRQRVTTAVGEARRVVDAHYSVQTLQRLRRRLVREPGSFASLASIFEAVDGLISKELANGLRQLQDERNNIAHRPLPDKPSGFLLDDARELLNEVIDVIF